MSVILKQTDTYCVSIAQQFLFAVLSISLFVKMSNVWCTDLFDKYRYLYFVHFLRKGLTSVIFLSVVAQSLHSHSLCFDTVSTLKKVSWAVPNQRWNLGRGLPWQSQQPTPPGMCSLLLYGALSLNKDFIRSPPNTPPHQHTLINYCL